MEWTVEPPKYGDIVRTKVAFYHHYGIFVSEDRVIQFGLPDNVYRPADEIKVIATDVYAFLQGGELEVAKPTREEKRTLKPAKKIVEMAEERIGEGGYDILHNNCEHFVNECAFGKHHCEFLQNERKKLRLKLGK